MSDLIDRQAAIDAIEKTKTVRSENNELYVAKINAEMNIMQLPSAEPQERKTEKALRLLLEWAIECDFGYDNIPEEYEKYKDEIKDMGYTEGLIYIAEREVDNERND